MNNNTEEKFEKPNKSGPLEDKPEGHHQSMEQLSSDMDFDKLQAAYQNANFQRCNELLNHLEERYPGQPILEEYKEEIELRQTVKSVTVTNNKVKKREKKTKSFRLGVFAIISTLFVMLILVFSYFYFNIKVSARQIQEETTQLNDLEEQAEHLLLVGKPQPAAEVLERMRAIDPNYEALPELEKQTYDLLLLKNKYQTALDLLDQGQNQEALKLFKEIEDEWPGLWDVRQQINTLENQNEL